MRVGLQRLAVLLLITRSAFAQVRLEPLTPTLSPVPAVSFSPSSLPTPTRTSPVAAAPDIALSAPTILAAPTAAAPAPAAAVAPVPIPAAPIASDVSAAAAPIAAARAAEEARPDAAAPASPLDAFWDGAAARDKSAVEAFVPLARSRADEHGRVTPELQDALTRIERAHAARFTRAARREWQTLVASLGAKTTLPIVTPPVAVPYWQKEGHPLANYQSRPKLPAEADVVIVGAGLTGASAAYHLAEEARAKGLKVVVLDGGDPATQASGRNGGNFELLPENYRGDYLGLAGERARLSRPLHPGATEDELRALGDLQARAILRLSARNREILLDVVRREGIDADLTPRGWVRAAVNKTEDAGLAEEVELARSLGLDMRALTPLELDEAMGVPPGTNKFGGRLSESDGNYHPFKYVNGVLKAALDKGVELYARTAVRRLKPLEGGGHLVVTGRGAIRAKQVILANGGFISRLVPELDSIKLHRSQVQVTEHAEEKWQGRTVTADQGDLYGHFPQGEAYTDADGFRRAPLLLGGGRDNPTRADDADAIMRSHVISKRLIGRRDRMFPELKGVPPSREWAGPLDYAPDQMPGIGVLRPGLIVAAGFSGYGGSYTQAAGEAAARLALTGEAPEWVPQDVFSPRRFLRPGGAADGGPAAPWLVLKHPRLAAALDDAVRLARTTEAGRRALDAAEKALAAQGRTLAVDVKDLGRNWGEYDYMNGRLRLDRRLFKEGREADLAAILAHELTHLVQHASGLLPSNALELEIEAHLLDMALTDELGAPTYPDTFGSQARKALAESPAAFIALLQEAVPGSPFLRESSFASIADQLEYERDEMSFKKGERAARLTAALDEDLRRIRSKKGRAAYREFSRRVLAELSRRSAAARRAAARR